MNRNEMQMRCMQSELKTRAEPDNGKKYIEGYFAVFNRETKLFDGAYEEIAPGAFDSSLSNDVRVLVNHDTTLVLGRNKSGTAEIKADSYGLFGRVEINESDTDAMNLYARVQRGDVDQCSFGFDIKNEETEWRGDGSVKWTMKDIDLFEISVCTFPAYEDTAVKARSMDIKTYKEKEKLLRKQKMKERLHNGTKTINDQ